MKKMKIVLTVLLMVLTIAGISTKNAHAAGEVAAWGYNWWGQLGDGTTGDKSTPVQVSGLTGITAVAGEGYHSLALKSDGTVWAWGNNEYGQLGDGTWDSKPTPIQVLGLTGITSISGGAFHSLAVKNDGTVWAWGHNGYGQLGDGTTVSKSTPVQVLGLTGITVIATGWYHSFAVKNDGTVCAWGNNQYGQLGDGTWDSKPTPVQVLGLTGITAIAGGWNHSFAVKNDGTVWAWGRNWEGYLGDGTMYNDKSTPVQVLGLTGVTAVAGGANHSLALKSDGTVWAWGNNGVGQLGDGTVDTTWPYGKPTPIQVLGLTGITVVAAGGGHSLAIKNDGTVWAWGYNWYGQLGDGTSGWENNKSTPVQVLSLTGSTAVAAGGEHSLAIGRLAANIVVQIDIKPGSYPNSIKLQDTGNIPVAIFGSSTFDVNKIDVSSLQLNGTEVRIVKGKGYLSSYEDVNGDGFMDMVGQFDRGGVQLTIGDTSATVTGKTSDGTAFQGSDSVRVIE